MEQFVIIVNVLDPSLGKSILRVNNAEREIFLLVDHFDGRKRNEDSESDCKSLLETLLDTPFLYKQSIFDPRPKNCLSFSKKTPPKNV